MATEPPEREEPSLLDLGEAAAARLGGDWQLDADLPTLEAAPAEPPPAPPEPPPPARPGRMPALFPSRVAADTETPPSPEQIVEAMLFVGGPPLTAATACTAIRNLTAEQFQHAIDQLNRKYRAQRRPYQVQPRDGGFTLAILPAYRHLRERLHGGPKEARLSQPALDVLAIVAYQQPVGKADIDAIRGGDSASLLRQLVRLGLITAVSRAEAQAPGVRYGTTPRLLALFGLRSLEELPRLGDTEAI